MVQACYYRLPVLCLLLVLALVGLLGCPGDDPDQTTGPPALPDTTPPPPPVLNLSGIRSPVNAASVTLTGQAEANSLVTLARQVQRAVQQRPSPRSSATRQDEMGSVVVTQQLTGGNTAFSLSVSLARNETNVLRVTARDAAGNESDPATVIIVEDSIPPGPPIIDAIPTPTNATMLTISGTTEEAATVMITGGSAAVSGMTVPPLENDVGAIATFALDVPLVPEVDNELSVVVMDAAENASTPVLLTIRRDFTPPPPPTLFTTRNRTSSTRQSVSGMAEPGTMIAVRGGSREVVTSPADGAMGVFVVAVPLQQNADNLLSVTATDPLGNVSNPSTVLITHDPTAPSLGINVISGDLQFGIVGTPLARPLIAKVMDDRTGDPVPGIAVMFSVVAGGGSVNGGGSSITKMSDANGTVSTQWTLGPEPQVEQMVVANFSQNAGMPVMFMATGLAPNPGGTTSFTGVVLTTQSLVAVPGVTVRIEGVTTTTDATGRFVLTGVPTGRHILHVEGRTATRPETFPDLVFDVDVLAGQENRLGRPIFLPIIDTASSVTITGMETQPVVVRSTAFPGFALEIQPGSATFPDGSRSGVVTVTAIPPDQVPMSLLDNGLSGVVVSIQPGGTIFNPPARVTYPNLDGLAPGERVNLTSFDHDAGAFINIGPGTVSADGSTITSDPGVGIRVAAWHAAVPARRIPATLLMGRILNAELFTCECWSNGARGSRPLMTGEVMIPNVPVGRVGIAETVAGVTALRATCFCRCQNTLTIPLTPHIVISDDSEDRNANGMLDAGEDANGNGRLDKAGMGSQITVAQAADIISRIQPVWQQCCVKFTVNPVQILSRPQAEAREYAASDAVLNALIARQQTANTLNIYFVQEITGTTVGFQSGNAPSPGVKPTGVFVEDRTNLGTEAKSLAHEIGHFLGLVHATSAGKNIMEQGDAKGTELVDMTGGGVTQMQCTVARNRHSDGNMVNGAMFEMP